MTAAAKADATISKAKKKLAEAIEGVDPKAANGIADLCKLCESLAKLKAVELKSDEGDFGSAL